MIAHSDLRGDSYQLSRMAADSGDCRAIVFCGVHFMAETADILANRPEKLAARNGERVTVVLPDLAAGCSMADMAAIEQVEAAWEDLGQIIDTADLTPVTYINSAASLKAFCGRHGGIVCTSSNAEAVLKWAFQRTRRVLFFPDQHLGRNTALRMGMPNDQMPVWDPHEPDLGGNTEEAIRAQPSDAVEGPLQRPPDVSAGARAPVPPADSGRQDSGPSRVLRRRSNDLADVSGSTGKIIQAVEQAPPGTKWAIGTELHLVNRLKKEHPEQEIHFLSPVVCMCATMYRIDLAHLCWSLENLAAGRHVNVIEVDSETTAGRSSRWSGCCR